MLDEQDESRNKVLDFTVLSGEDEEDEDGNKMVESEFWVILMMRVEMSFFDDTGRIGVGDEGCAILETDDDVSHRPVEHPVENFGGFGQESVVHG